MRKYRRSWLYLLAMFVTLVVALGTWSIVAQAQMAADDAAAKLRDLHLILLRAGEVDTRQGKPALDPSLRIDAYPPGEQGYYIVQFTGEVREDRTIA